MEEQDSAHVEKIVVHGDHGFCYSRIACRFPRSDQADPDLATSLDTELWSWQDLRQGFGDPRTFLGAILNCVVAGDVRSVGFLASGLDMSTDSRRPTPSASVSFHIENPIEVLADILLLCPHPLLKFGLFDEHGAQLSQTFFWRGDGWHREGSHEKGSPQQIRKWGRSFYAYRLRASAVGAHHVTLLASSYTKARVEIGFIQAVSHTHEVDVRDGTPFMAGAVFDPDRPTAAPAGSSFFFATAPTGEQVLARAEPNDAFWSAGNGPCLTALSIAEPMIGTWRIRVKTLVTIPCECVFQSLPTDDARNVIDRTLRPKMARFGVLARGGIKCTLCKIALVGILVVCMLALLALGAIVALALPPFSAVLTLVAAGITVQLVGRLLYGSRFGDALEVFCGCRKLDERIRTLNIPYDRFCNLATHNSYWHAKWLGPANQRWSVREQLDRGVTALMLDMHVATFPGGGRNIYLCHGGADSGCSAFFDQLHRLGSDPVTLEQVMRDVVEHMTASPDAVVTVFFESRVKQGNQALVDAAMMRSGAEAMAFRPDKRVHGVNAQPWDVKSQGWPTLRWMIDNGTRIVLFSDQAADAGSTFRPGREQDGLPFLWDFVLENDHENAMSGVEHRRHTHTFAGSNISLFLLNHFWRLPFLLAAHRNNQSRFIVGRAEEFRDAYPRPIPLPRLPNFVAVDFFEVPDGQAADAVREINAMWQAFWP